MGNSASSQPATLDMVKDIQLKQVGLDNAPEVTASSLWKDTPALVYVVRRPGCALCREHAVDLMKAAPQFKTLGVPLIAVVYEELGALEFAQEFFAQGTVYLDEAKGFHKSLGLRWLGLHGMAKPSVLANAYRVHKKEVKGNFEGEGRLLGGLLVIGKGNSGIAFEHRERVFGDHASIEEILSACERASAQDFAASTSGVVISHSNAANSDNSSSNKADCTDTSCSVSPKPAPAADQTVKQQ